MAIAPPMVLALFFLCLSAQSHTVMMIIIPPPPIMVIILPQNFSVGKKICRSPPLGDLLMNCKILFLIFTHIQLYCIFHDYITITNGLSLQRQSIRLSCIPPTVLQIQYEVIYNQSSVSFRSFFKESTC